MAKSVNDDKPVEAVKEPTPASGGELRGMLASYEEKQGEKKEIAEDQKAQLKEFEATHGLPVWVAKIIRKFDQLEDPANRSHAWNALMHAGHEMGFDQQPDMFRNKAKAKHEPEVEKSKRPTRARPSA